jgi:histone deacetylase HOS3
MPAQASSSRELRPALDIYLAPAVQSHRFVRSRDVSLIVERPERIRALCLGVAGVLGRIEAASPGGEAKVKEEDELSAALQGLSVDAARAPIAVHLHTSAAPLSPPSPALVDIHSAPLPGSEEPYVEVLARLCAAAPSSPPPPAAHKPVQRSPARRGSESSDEEPQHVSEVPAPLSQGDLYLCGPSADSDDRGTAGAIAASLGALGAALTRMYATDEQRQPALLPHGNAAAARRAFVLARPPGHHCGPASPSGFCWVNNVAVAAAMAYREQMVDRVIILDVDLHHGSEYGSVREGGWSSAASLGRVVRRHLASTWSGEASSIDEPAS